MRTQWFHLVNVIGCIVGAAFLSLSPCQCLIVRSKHGSWLHDRVLYSRSAGKRPIRPAERGRPPRLPCNDWLRKNFQHALAMTPDSAMESIMTLSSSSMQSFGPSIMTSAAGFMDQDTAEALAGPFFGLSLFPYLIFLYFLNRPEADCPKGVTVGFATCLLFVLLTIPAAVIAKLWYDVSLADCDWLHGSAESLLTITNLVTVLAFRQALTAKESARLSNSPSSASVMPVSATSYGVATTWVVILTALAALTAAAPALADAQVHTPYLGGFLDLPPSVMSWCQQFLGMRPEPDNALSVPCWIIHVSSLVEFLVAMGFCWRWADAVDNPTWKGLTWGLLPLHSSGITACTYHLFYNGIPLLVPLQAILTCIGNTSAAWAAYRIARSGGYQLPEWIVSLSPTLGEPSNKITAKPTPVLISDVETALAPSLSSSPRPEAPSLIGFEDLGQALAQDTDYSFLMKLFVGCAAVSYLVKYGALWFDFPLDANVSLGLAVVIVPSSLNAYKWYRRSRDPTFEGWF